MKKYIVTEEFDAFIKDNNEVMVPVKEGTILFITEGLNNDNELVPMFSFNDEVCWQYNYTIEDKIKSTKKPWGWKIIKDNVSKPEDTEYYKVGKEYGNYQGGKFRYRMCDDDNNVYFYIYSDIDPNKGTESQIFQPLDWAMNFAGAAYIEYKDKETGKYKII